MDIRADNPSNQRLLYIRESAPAKSLEAFEHPTTSLSVQAMQ